MRLERCSTCSLIAAWAVFSAAIFGCGDDELEPFAFSETISTRLGGIKEGEVTDGQAATDKKVKEESGNPYKVFLDEVRDHLGGNNPTAIGVTSATIRIHADTVGVNGFEEVFESMEVFLADHNTTVPLGRINVPLGTSQQVPISATAVDLEALQESLLTDEVRVGVRGPVVDAPPAQFDLRLTVDIVFEALH